MCALILAEFLSFIGMTIAANPLRRNIGKRRILGIGSLPARPVFR